MKRSVPLKDVYYSVSQKQEGYRAMQGHIGEAAPPSVRRQREWRESSESLYYYSAGNIHSWAGSETHDGVCGWRVCNIFIYTYAYKHKHPCLPINIESHNFILIPLIPFQYHRVFSSLSLFWICTFFLWHWESGPVSFLLYPLYITCNLE